MGLADTIIALEDGRIAQKGNPEVFLVNTGYVAKLDLVSCNEGPSEESAENIGVTRAESRLVESFISVPATPEDAHDISDLRRKTGDWSVYGYYLASSSRYTIAIFLITMAIWVFCTEFASTYTK